MKKLALIALLVALPITASAQQPGGNMQQRQQLQRMVVQRFMERVSVELNLDANTRAKLEQHLRTSGEERRELARSTNEVRGRLMRATRDSTTSDADFRKMLGDMTALRQREEDLWKRDQDALSKILTPRQQARFVFLWLRFNEQIRDAGMRAPAGRPF